MRKLACKASLLIVLFTLMVGLFGCANVKISTQSPDAYWRSYDINAVNSQTLSHRTRQFLRQNDLRDEFGRNPYALLDRIKIIATSAPQPDSVFAAAELAFYLAQKERGLNQVRRTVLYWNAAKYAFLYLFDPLVCASVNAFDPHTRVASDIYNRALTKTLAKETSEIIQPDRDFKAGGECCNIATQIQFFGFVWKDSDFSHFLFASAYKVSGIINQNVVRGLGVPLIAVRSAREPLSPLEHYLPPTEMSFAATAFIRFSSSVLDNPEAPTQAVLEIYDPLRIASVEVSGRTAPLESDLTTPLGYTLAGYNFNLLELEALRKPESWKHIAGLYMFEPYERGKIPVVFVHGLNSSPIAWLQMFNDLMGHERIRSKYSFWFFVYPTGYAFQYSAALLRSALHDILSDLDPEHASPSLSQMILVGHSMGGLLTKSMITDSGNEIWKSLSNKNFDELTMTDEMRTLLRSVLFFKAQPFIKRAVFIATPHRGSRLADGIISRIAALTILIPKFIIEGIATILDENPGAFNPEARVCRFPNSVTSLSSKNPMLLKLSELPVADGVVYHSIIPLTDPRDGEKGTDGVVPYKSAHLSGAKSELIVKSRHSCESHPLVVKEVQRILLEALKGAD